MCTVAQATAEINFRTQGVVSEMTHTQEQSDVNILYGKKSMSFLLSHESIIDVKRLF